jgi:hypothetical protein
MTKTAASNWDDVRTSVVGVDAVWKARVEGGHYTTIAGAVLLAGVHMIVAWDLLGGGTAVVSLEGDDAVDETVFTWAA